MPDITKNLLSVSQLAKDNSVFFEFHPTVCFVKDQATQEILLKGLLKDGLYKFDVQFFKPQKASTGSTQQSFDMLSSAMSVNLVSLNKNQSLEVWHRWLGHAPYAIVEKVLKGRNLSLPVNEQAPLCVFLFKG